MDTAPRSASFGFTMLLGVVLFCLFLGLTAWWFGGRRGLPTYDEQRAAQRVARLSNLRRNNAARLQQYAWVDKEKGLARIPLERAMDLTLAELRSKPVQPSQVPVENPYPYGLRPPAQAAATPAAPAPAPAPAATPPVAPAPGMGEPPTNLSAPAATPSANPPPVMEARP